MTTRISPVTLLVILVVILRIPSLFEPYWYGDEGIYLTLGEAIKQGLLLYRDIFDHKPPAIYLVAAAAGSIFWFKFFLLVWHAATVVIFYKLSSKLLGGRPRPTLAASTVFALLTTLPLLEGNIANSELFMIGPAIAALYIIFSWGHTTRNLSAAGLLFSLSILFKVPAVFDLAAVCFFWLVCSTRGSLLPAGRLMLAVKKSFILILAAALPILLSVLYWAQKGALSQYINTAWTLNFTYIAAWTAPQVSLVSTIAQAGLLTRTAVLALVLLVIFVARKRFDQVTLFACLWFTFALFATLLSSRPYPHYLIQVIGPLALLISLLVFGKEKYRFLTVPFLLLLTFSLVFYKFGYYPTVSYYKNFLMFAAGQRTKQEYFENFDKRMPMIYQLGEILTSRTARRERIFVWGTAPELYALARRLPPGKFVTAFHIQDFDGYAQTMEALRANSPKYIIVLKAESAPFPEFFSFLHKNYLYLETVDGAEIWKAVSPTLLRALRSR